MTKMKWWLILVGGFYLLLAGSSLWVLFVNPQLFGTRFPFASNSQSIRASSDAWLIFVLEIGVLGVLILYATRDPSHARVLLMVVSVLELIRGAGGDLLWTMRGWPTANYMPFMIVHLISGFTGLIFLRQKSTNPAV